MKRIIIIFGFVSILALTQGSSTINETAQPKEQNTVYYYVTGAVVTDTTDMPNGIYIKTQNNEMTTKIIKK